MSYQHSTYLYIKTTKKSHGKAKFQYLHTTQCLPHVFQKHLFSGNAFDILAELFMASLSILC